ncbi:MAG TPA: NAD(P)/FAD-dependent oxidoreductase [Nitrospiraceae bacterium]|nr:NAD(P)/FAD-dependent oxidoreductase [Nitrospiraceae bacterium]
MADILIVGAGAAGLAAAIFAAEQRKGITVHLLDGATTIGAKILVSGGGRCNVTHEIVTPEDFHGNRHIIRNVLAAFGTESARRWFASMGVELKREPTGKLFPVTDKARTVLDALTGRCRDLGVVLSPGHRVTGILREEVNGEREACQSPFRVHYDQGVLLAKRVILATGGRSLPRTGSDGFGYELARRFGHRVTMTAPALVPLVLEQSMFHQDFSGLSLEVELSSQLRGKTIDRRTGSLLWTHVGISGPVVMDASRFWTLPRTQGERAMLRANFLPGRTQEQARTWLLEEAARDSRRSLLKTVAQVMPERLAAALCRHAQCDAQRPAGLLRRTDRERLLMTLTRFQFPVVDDRGWNHAEVTAGGVPLEEINFRTMESKLVPGLYLVGEILDCDGRIGGFNFQWAWATGYLAGRAAAESIEASACP